MAGGTQLCLHKQAFGRLGIAPALEDFIQNQPILVDRTPQPELVTLDRHNDRVEMPDIAGLGLSVA